MLKKPCPYHKMPINHSLEQCNMLKKYYSRAAAKEGEAKKDGVAATPAASRRLPGSGERLPHLRGTDRGHVQQPAQAGAT
jgi:hypothetical protein